MQQEVCEREDHLERTMGVEVETIRPGDGKVFFIGVTQKLEYISFSKCSCFLIHVFSFFQERLFRRVDRMCPCTTLVRSISLLIGQRLSSKSIFI